MVTTRAASRSQPVAANTTRRPSTSFLDKWDDRGRDGDVITVKKDGRLRSVSHLINNNGVASSAAGHDGGWLRSYFKNERRPSGSSYNALHRGEEDYFDDTDLDEPRWSSQLQYTLHETRSTLWGIWNNEYLPPLFFLTIAFALGAIAAGLYSVAILYSFPVLLGVSGLFQWTSATYGFVWPKTRGRVNENYAVFAGLYYTIAALVLTGYSIRGYYIARVFTAITWSINPDTLNPEKLLKYGEDSHVYHGKRRNILAIVLPLFLLKGVLWDAYSAPVPLDRIMLYVLNIFAFMVLVERIDYEKFARDMGWTSRPKRRRRHSKRHTQKSSRSALQRPVHGSTLGYRAGYAQEEALYRRPSIHSLHRGYDDDDDYYSSASGDEYDLPDSDAEDEPVHYPAAPPIRIPHAHDWPEYQRTWPESLQDMFLLPDFVITIGGYIWSGLEAMGGASMNVAVVYFAYMAINLLGQYMPGLPEYTGDSVPGSVFHYWRASLIWGKELGQVLLWAVLSNIGDAAKLIWDIFSLCVEIVVIVVYNVILLVAKSVLFVLGIVGYMWSGLVTLSQCRPGWEIPLGIVAFVGTVVVAGWLHLAE
ncbi:hypothetical protein BDV96DRAFT_603570 [Lophiotrema nucula]|uniref:Uncharacterized protein n=1 Tax=Lophiotrema nucula TaxID=690887 RepID=A0A6A5YW14_9PLEO|nr:hypothetical protein BDV96DRAFT_603570 [Lophiotrema nucula]